jgi:DNA-binding transcriptional ArsR family regulator
VDKSPTPSLLPIFRSQQQAELLALVLGDPEVEHTLTELADRTGIPYPSVHREVERAEAAGLVSSRLVGRTRLVRADPSSPYFNGLSEVLVRAFGVPWVLAQALDGIADIDAVYATASSAERQLGRPVQVTIRSADWLTEGTGTFHDTVAGRPMVPIAVTRTDREDRSPVGARPRGRRSAPSTAPTPRRRR